jgi:hypothetical protein
MEQVVYCIVFFTLFSFFITTNELNVNKKDMILVINLGKYRIVSSRDVY